MKKLLLYTLSIIALSSCEDGEHRGLFDKKDNPCPIVTADEVPTLVKTAQERDYAGIQVTTWFNVEGNGYTALFTKDAVETKVYYDNNGNVLRTEIEEYSTELNDDEENDEEENDDEGCDCELDEEGEH